jgi:hypothetical protein
VPQTEIPQIVLVLERQVPLALDLETASAETQEGAAEVGEVGEHGVGRGAGLLVPGEGGEATRPTVRADTMNNSKVPAPESDL